MQTRLASSSALFVALGVVLAVGCSSNDKSGGDNGSQDTGVDTAPVVPLGEAECAGLSLGLSRPVTGVPGGKQSVWALTSHSVLQSPSPTGTSSMLSQIVGGKFELYWLGTVDGDVNVTGGTLVYPGDDPAPSGAYCVLPGTVFHKTATGGKVDLVVTPGTDCATGGGGDAGVDDAGAGDAGSGSNVIMKACLDFTP
jgi:hypothetical protein